MTKTPTRDACWCFFMPKLYEIKGKKSIAHSQTEHAPQCRACRRCAMREVLRSTRSPAVYEAGYRCGGTGDSAAAGRGYPLRRGRGYPLRRGVPHLACRVKGWVEKFFLFAEATKNFFNPGCAALDPAFQARKTASKRSERALASQTIILQRF